MTRLSPIALDDLDPETRALIENAEDLMGFVPNDALVMARNPGLTRAMWGLVAAIYGPGKVDNGLKRLIGEAASKAAHLHQATWPGIAWRGCVGQRFPFE